MPDRAFQKTYRNAPKEIVEQLKAFRDAHPVIHIDVEIEEEDSVESVGWDYIVSQADGDPILFLHDVGSSAGTHFRQISALNEAGYRVIAPTIPGTPSMKFLADGLAAILETEEVEKAHLWGVSFGGMLAQVFINRYPARVGDVILSHTMAAQEKAAQHYNQQRRQIRSMPRFLYGSTARMESVRALRSDVLDLSADEQAFWKAYYNELYPDIVTKSMYLARLEAGAEFHQHPELSGERPDGWDGRVLIIESTRDSSVDDSNQEALKAAFEKNAEIVTFSRYGHMGFLARSEENVEAVLAFLK